MELADRFMEALERCDIDAARAMYASDAKIWHNFSQKLQSVDENLKTLQWMHTVLSNIEYHIVRREAVPGGYYQQHELHGTLKSGEAFSMPACAIIKVEGDVIVSLDEYLDSRHTKPLHA
jgi:limonene-1,2-epoxide hydrolase